ncbi:Cyclic AMP receptor-like protein A [Escovopsis weberi]|uniref:Cyclic AMP receptor-like protein A n=1 Tax=Escovopsis weberi TaxID=150374 RepID=A0A0M9VXA3_ESCWE|nr:Cyclic AMP receptor-like protein A [Escovopsis weberi]
MDLANDSGSALTPFQVEVLATIERVGAALSMVSVLLAVFSYAMVKKLRTVPNQFLVIASLANFMASIAAMMGYDGLAKGEDSSICQVQGFIFEWFTQSDPWWLLAMAVNVFLVFFCHFKPSRFRKNFWVFCIVCFGGPFLPAIVLFCIRDDPRGLVFGDATRSPATYRYLVAVSRFPQRPNPDVAPSNGGNVQFESRMVAIFETIREMRIAALEKYKQQDRVKMAYLRISFIFGFSVLLTWIPSSLNRLYTMAYDGRVSYALMGAVRAALRETRDRIHRRRAERAAALEQAEVKFWGPGYGACNNVQSAGKPDAMSIFDKELDEFFSEKMDV